MTEFNDRYKLGCEALRLAGFKLTPCRKFVLKNMVESKQPHSVKSLLELAGADSDVDQSTLYRTLEIMVDLEILEVIRVSGKRQTHYVWKYNDYHNHAVCTKCGSVAHISIYCRDDVVNRVEELTGFTNVKYTIEVEGLCAECAKKQNENS